MDLRGEEVDADQREVTAGLGGLLRDSQHRSVLVDLRDAEVPGVGDLLYDHLCRGAAGAKVRGGPCHPRQQDVVAEEQGEVVVAEEGAGQPDRVGEPQGPFLGDVGDTGTEAGSVADGGFDLRGPVAHHDADLGDTQVADAVQDVCEDGPVGDRDELFGHRVAERPQPGA